MDKDKEIYFQDFIDDDILIRGLINKETEMGEALVYKLVEKINLDLKETGVKKQPYLMKEYCAKFAHKTLKRSKDEGIRYECIAKCPENDYDNSPCCFKYIKNEEQLFELLNKECPCGNKTEWVKDVSY